MKRTQYSPEVIAQASLEVAQELGGLMLASRVREVVAAGEDPFHLVFQALGNGRVMLERAEQIRRQQINGPVGAN